VWDLWTFTKFGKIFQSRDNRDTTEQNLRGKIAQVQHQMGNDETNIYLNVNTKIYLHNILSTELKTHQIINSGYTCIKTMMVNNH
jgi:hypothetical protein